MDRVADWPRASVLVLALPLAGERPGPEVFRSEILPGLRHMPIGELVAATGLSQHYVSLIRLGKRVPHLRHWEALRKVGDHA